MKIGWVLRVPVEQRDGRAWSPMAGIRMRTLLPAEELAALGAETILVQLPLSGVLDADAAAQLQSCDAVVFAPVAPAPGQSIDDAAPAVFELIAHLKRNSVRTIADIHDDHFEVEGRIAYFTGLVRNVDAVFVNSPAMAELVARYSQQPVRVIADPYEGAPDEPRFAPVAGMRLLDRVLPWRAARLQLAWFGHQSNRQPAFDLAQALAARKLRWPLDFALVSRAGFGIDEFCATFNHYHGSRCRTRFIEWSPAATQGALAQCDLAVIPVDPALRKSGVKSANRLVEILRAGRFALAHPVASYAEFADYAWIGEDIAAGIEWAMRHRDEVDARIRAGQRYVEEKFSPRAIGMQWRDALHEIIS